MVIFCPFGHIIAFFVFPGAKKADEGEKEDGKGSVYGRERTEDDYSIGERIGSDQVDA